MALEEGMQVNASKTVNSNGLLGGSQASASGLDIISASGNSTLPKEVSAENLKAVGESLNKMMRLSTENVKNMSMEERRFLETWKDMLEMREKNWERFLETWKVMLDLLEKKEKTWKNMLEARKDMLAMWQMVTSLAGLEDSFLDAVDKEAFEEAFEEASKSRTAFLEEIIASNTNPVGASLKDEEKAFEEEMDKEAVMRRALEEWKRVSLEEKAVWRGEGGSTNQK